MATVAPPVTSVDAGGAWGRLAELQERALHDRAGALDELARTFDAGRVPAGLDGETQGRFVAFCVRPGLDRALARLARVWLPWSGKRFDAAAARGENLLLGGRIAGFGFRTRVESGVLMIDYAAVRSNPRALRQVRDELVEIAPGVHLGQALWTGRGGPARLAYWALRSG
ncbi:MAG: hypothetical protein QOE65_763 [Solirubrobacteraceae bacterium]|jgi:hypothetical protein|nr:hypothetical protein [Solirubrobacteraceae bacterium]